MPVRAVLLILFLPLLSAGCVLPRPGAKAAPEVRLSAEDSKRVERLYYRAVSAYTDNDMPAAGGYLDQISKIHPSYPPALQLREKIRRVSGGKR
jgi:hypothetical protein